MSDEVPDVAREVISSVVAVCDFHRLDDVDCPAAFRGRFIEGWRAVGTWPGTSRRHAPSTRRPTSRTRSVSLLAQRSDEPSTVALGDDEPDVRQTGRDALKGFGHDSQQVCASVKHKAGKGKRHRGVLRAGRCDDVVNGSHRPRRRLPDHVRLTTQVHEVHRGQVRHETGAALTREEPPATTPVEERGPAFNLRWSTPSRTAAK
jgi:hypothetical protein